MKIGAWQAKIIWWAQMKLRLRVCIETLWYLRTNGLRKTLVICTAWQSSPFAVLFFFFSLLSALVLVVTWCKVLSSESYCQDLAWRRTPLSCRKDLMVWFWWNYSIVNTVIGFVLFWEVSCSLHITYEVHRFPRLQKACDLDNQACLRRL